jgi:hypothetical protein
MNQNLVRGIWGFALLALLVFAGPDTLQAQEAADRDFRIDASAAPPNAQAFIRACSFTGKIKWFEEHSGEEITYEAKTKHNKRAYSIEFFPDGKIKDAEIDIDTEDIPGHAMDPIRSFLAGEYTNYRIIKAQVQWTADADILLELIQAGQSKKAFTTQYELVLVGMKRGQRIGYEYLFSDTGAVLRIMHLLPNEIDHYRF